MTLDAATITAIAGVGLAAGALGGLLGIGGSVVMIPALAIILGSKDPESQHLYQAAAMAVNIAVSAPAAAEHIRRGALHKRLFVWVLASALIAIVLGVLASDRMDGLTLRRVFAVFLVYVALNTILKLLRGTPELKPSQERVTPLRGSTVGGVMGFAAGLLGIGGGTLTVPLAQTLCRLPLKQCIAVSSAVMCITAAVGATMKIWTLPQHGFKPTHAIAIALLLTPTAVLGGGLGARLTHRLPLSAMRGVFIALLLAAAWKMATQHA